MNSLEITDLTKSYPNFTLDHINLTVEEGTIMGFIGENGAGKTTTIACILNMIQRDEGTIHIFGKEIGGKTEDSIKQEIGVVLDECFFHDNLNAKDISVILSHIYQNWDQSLYESYLDRFQLSSKQLVKEFSRGMKMKLNIATSLSHHPRLLLLDEATGGLDPVVRNEILDVFYEYIQEENHSILISSHITSDLEKICDYITYLHRGKVAFSMEKDGILDYFGVLKCDKAFFEHLSKQDYLGYRHNNFSYEILVSDRNSFRNLSKDYVIDPASLEDIMVLYGKN